MRKLTLVCVSLCVVAMLVLLLAPQPARADVSIEIVCERGYPVESEYFSRYVVEGIVKNVGTSNASHVTVRLTIYWFEGSPEIGQNSQEVSLPILRPGETSPFWVYVLYDFPYLIDYYTLEVAAFETTEEPYEPLTVVSENMFWKESYGTMYRYLWGEIQNMSTDYLKGYKTRVYVGWFEPDGDLVDLESVYLPLGTSEEYSACLSPGDKVPFYSRIDMFEEFGSYQMWYKSEALDPGLYCVPLSLTVTNSFFDQWNNFIVEGTISNNGDVRAEDNRTVITYRDSSGLPVESSEDSYYQHVPDLDPGETKNFKHEDLYPPDPDEFDTFDIVIWSASITTTQPPTPTPTITPTPTSTPTNTPTPTPTTTPTPTNTPPPPSAWVYLPVVFKHYGAGF